MQQSKGRDSRFDSAVNPNTDPLRIRIAIICVLTLVAILFIIFGSDQAVRLLYSNKQKAVTAQLAFEIDEIILNHFDSAVRHLVPASEIQELCTGSPENPDHCPRSTFRIHCLRHEQPGNCSRLFPLW